LDGCQEKTYGGCEGPDAMYVTLISSDGHEFTVKIEHALTSGTIKAMLSGPGYLIFLFLPILRCCYF
uniref:SKP1 component POZ domain-containing protein n=1 Tax=Castor canadensis TaxID=51338 RepID=A0A8C0WAH7_CASCN